MGDETTAILINVLPFLCGNVQTYILEESELLHNLLVCHTQTLIINSRSEMRKGEAFVEISLGWVNVPRDLDIIL